MRQLRSPKLWIAVLVGVGLLGSGVDLYVLYLHPGKGAVVAPRVGARRVARAIQAEDLIVVNTTPTFGDSSVRGSSPIAIDFNLPVDPPQLQPFFSVLPAVSGSLSQGADPESVLFTPDRPFDPGSSVNLVLRKGVRSRDGFALQDDFDLTFQTAPADQSVVFQSGGQLARIVDAQSNQRVAVTVQVGTSVPTDVGVQVFRATTQDLLADLQHTPQASFIGQGVPTARLTSVANEGTVTNGQVLDVAQPDGIYVMVAFDARGQYGEMWLDFARYGVMLRQDDQKVVVAGQDLSTGDTGGAFNITFYNLEQGVHVLQSGTFTGLGEFSARYPAHIDVAVASSGGEDMVVPVAVPQTDADIKVVGDLSQQAQVYLTTDRPAYQKGDTVSFVGLVRDSNDQAYTVPKGTTMDVWSGSLAAPLVQQHVQVLADGGFSGSFVLPDSAFSPDGTPAQVVLYAQVDNPSSAGQSPPELTFSPFSTVIEALGGQAPAAHLTVTFDRPQYVRSDTIVASISGTNGSGQPLANQALSAAIYATRHQVAPKEEDSFPQPSTWGTPAQQDGHVQLDASGRATYSFKADAAQKAADEDVTLVVTDGSGATAAVGARTAPVYQAVDEVFLLSSREVYRPGETIRVPFLVESRAGDRVGGAPLAYELDQTVYQGSAATTTVVASGLATADGSGLGTVKIQYSGAAGGLTLRVMGKDSAGSSFEDSRMLTVTADTSNLMWFGPTDMLSRLDVATDRVAYAVGDRASLTVTAPSAVTVLLSLERGRIHKYSWQKLSQGDNSISLDVTPDLAPGFDLTFSYFTPGGFVTEGMPILINNHASQLAIDVSADRSSYSQGANASLAITVRSGAGAPVTATLIVLAYESRMSVNRLVDQPSVAAAFLTPAPRGTNVSSSLVGVGMWGGRCGGGGNPDQSPTIYAGPAVAFLPDQATDSGGLAHVGIPIPASGVRVVVIAATQDSRWGQTEKDLTVG